MTDTQLHSTAPGWMARTAPFAAAFTGFVLAFSALTKFLSPKAFVAAIGEYGLFPEPLILPLATGFGVDPIHLGIIFLANLEIGYTTPPVGLNLFIASQRFKRPIATLFRAALPFLGLMLIWLAIVTYVPAMSLWLK